jgi:hypothetical protein
MAKRDAKVVWSSSDGDLRKALDPKVRGWPPAAAFA